MPRDGSRLLCCLPPSRLPPDPSARPVLAPGPGPVHRVPLSAVLKGRDRRERAGWGTAEGGAPGPAERGLHHGSWRGAIWAGCHKRPCRSATPWAGTGCSGGAGVGTLGHWHSLATSTHQSPALTSHQHPLGHWHQTTTSTTTPTGHQNHSAHWPLALTSTTELISHWHPLASDTHWHRMGTLGCTQLDCGGAWSHGALVTAGGAGVNAPRVTGLGTTDSPEQQ